MRDGSELSNCRRADFSRVAQAAIGRALREVYSAELSERLAPRLANLLDQLNQREREGNARTSGLAGPPGVTRNRLPRDRFAIHPHRSPHRDSDDDNVCMSILECAAG